MRELHPTEVALEEALCNFTNGAMDSYIPDLWAEETKRNFEALGNAYDSWYSWRWGVRAMKSYTEAWAKAREVAYQALEDGVTGDALLAADNALRAVEEVEYAKYSVPPRGVEDDRPALFHEIHALASEERSRRVQQQKIEQIMHRDQLVNSAIYKLTIEERKALGEHYRYVYMGIP